MNDLSRSRIRWFLGLLLVALAGLWPGLASAAFPASQTSGYSYMVDFVTQAGPFSTRAEACAVVIIYNTTTQFRDGVPQGTDPLSKTCIYNRYDNNVLVVSGDSRASLVVTVVAQTYFCPSNSTLSGTSCTCDATHNEVGSTCVAKQLCEWAVGKRLLLEGSVVVPRANPTLCMYGCVFTAVDGSNDGMYWENDSGIYVGHYRVSGMVGSATVCTGAEGSGVDPVGTTPSTDPPTSVPDIPKLPCPAGENEGTATYGSTTVTLCTKAPVITADKQKTVEKQNAGTPQETTTERESETVCTGDLCKTTTTTITKDATGATVGVTVTVGDADKGTVCAKTPENKVCGKGGGTVGGSGYGNPQDGDLPGESLPVGNITPDSMAGFAIGNACPLPQTFTVFGKSQELSYTPLCDLAPKIKPLVMIAAAFGALLMVYGALTPRD